MDANEAIEMMKRCGEEIQSLKHRIEYLAPRADAYEVIRNIVMMQHRGGEGMPMSEDVVYMLNRAIKRELDREKQAEPPDRSKEYRGVVVSAQEEDEQRDNSSTVSGVEQYRAAKEAEALQRRLDEEVAAGLGPKRYTAGALKAKVEAEAKRHLGKRPGYSYDGVKD